MIENMKIITPPDWEPIPIDVSIHLEYKIFSWKGIWWIHASSIGEIENKEIRDNFYPIAEGTFYCSLDYQLWIELDKPKYQISGTRFEHEEGWLYNLNLTMDSDSLLLFKMSI